MKKLIAAVALSIALSITALPASAHDDQETMQQELTENCVACCLGVRPSLRERLRLSEDRCTEICSSWAVQVFEWLE